MSQSHLTELRVGNFKAFGPTQVIPIRPITLIFGPNSAGKSSIIHSLILAHELQVAQRNRLTSDIDVHRTEIGGPSVDLGGFQQFVHRARQRDKVELGFGLALATESRWQYGKDLDEVVDVSVTALLGQEERKGEPYDLEVRQQAERRALEWIRLEWAMLEKEGTPPTTAPEDAIESELATLRKERVQNETWFGPDCDKLVSSVRVSLDGQELISLRYDRVDALGRVLMVVDKLYWDHSFVRLIVEEARNGPRFRELSKGADVTSVLIYAALQASMPTFSSRGLCCVSAPRSDFGIRNEHLGQHPARPALEYLCEEVWGQIVEFLSHVDRTLATVLGEFAYLGPLRMVPTRDFSLHGHKEDTSADVGGKAWGNVLRDAKLRESTNDWLKRLEITNRLDICELITIDDVVRSFVRHAEIAEEKATGSQVHLPLGIEQALRERIEKQRQKEEKRQHRILERKQSPLTTEEKFKAILEHLEEEHLEAALDLEEETRRDRHDSVMAEALALADTIRKLSSVSPKLRLFDSLSGAGRSPNEVGTGTSQVLPIVATALGCERTVIAIEQPELHLHPKLQAELADLFLESALGERKNTFVLETHSEHLILRMLAGIRKGRVNPDDLAVLYVMPSAKGSKIFEMRVDQDGDFIDRWPGGFFEESYNERMAGR